MVNAFDSSCGVRGALPCFTSGSTSPRSAALAVATRLVSVQAVSSARISTRFCPTMSPASALSTM